MNTLIDKILVDCVNKAYEIMDSKSFGDPYKSAKSELLKAILDVVGEDEEIDYDYGDEEAYIRNKLRQELRTKFKELFKEK